MFLRFFGEAPISAKFGFTVSAINGALYLIATAMKDMDYYLREPVTTTLFTLLVLIIWSVPGYLSFIICLRRELGLRTLIAEIMTWIASVFYLLLSISLFSGYTSNVDTSGWIPIVLFFVASGFTLIPVLFGYLFYLGHMCNKRGEGKVVDPRISEGFLVLSIVLVGALSLWAWSQLN